MVTKMELPKKVAELGPQTPPERPTGFTKRFFLQPKLIPIYPLFGMLAIAFGLAGMTTVRHLALSPAVSVDKKKRASDRLQEMEDPQRTLELSEQYRNRSPLYLLSKKSEPGAVVAGVQMMPPVLPGDQSSATGVQGTHVNQGKPGGGI